MILQYITIFPPQLHTYSQILLPNAIVWIIKRLQFIKDTDGIILFYNHDS